MPHRSTIGAKEIQRDLCRWNILFLCTPTSWICYMQCSGVRSINVIHIILYSVFLFGASISWILNYFVSATTRCSLSFLLSFSRSLSVCSILHRYKSLRFYLLNANEKSRFNSIPKQMEFCRPLPMCACGVMMGRLTSEQPNVRNKRNNRAWVCGHRMPYQMRERESFFSVVLRAHTYAKNFYVHLTYDFPSFQAITEKSWVQEIFFYRFYISLIRIAKKKQQSKKQQQRQALSSNSTWYVKHLHANDQPLNKIASNEGKSFALKYWRVIAKKREYKNSFECFKSRLNYIKNSCKLYTIEIDALRVWMANVRDNKWECFLVDGPAAAAATTTGAVTTIKAHTTHLIIHINISFCLWIVPQVNTHATAASK